MRPSANGCAASQAAVHKPARQASGRKCSVGCPSRPGPSRRARDAPRQRPPGQPPDSRQPDTGMRTVREEIRGNRDHAWLRHRRHGRRLNEPVRRNGQDRPWTRHPVAEFAPGRREFVQFERVHRRTVSDEHARHAGWVGHALGAKRDRTHSAPVRFRRARVGELGRGSAIGRHAPAMATPAFICTCF